MDILNIIKDRRSIRKFKHTPVSDSNLDMVLEAGRWAPSGQNNQPWRFAIIRDADVKKEISALTRHSRIVLAADLLIVVLLDNDKSYHRVKDIQGIGACLQNMLLEIHSLGLGAVWLGEIIKSDEELRQVLGLGKNLELMAVIALGHPDETPKPTERKDTNELIVYKK